MDSLVKPDACRDMDDVRGAIDVIDEQIVGLIATRAQYVKRAASYKSSETAVKDPDRVAKVIESRMEMATKYGISPNLIKGIYQQMIDFFIAEELIHWRSLK